MIYPGFTPVARAMHGTRPKRWDAKYASPGGAVPSLILDFESQVFGTNGSESSNPVAGGRDGRPDWDMAQDGLLIEPARTNLIAHASAQTGWWAPVGTANLTDLSLSALGAFAGLSIASGGQSWHRAQVNSINFVANTEYFLTLWYRPDTASQMRITFYNASTAPATNLEVSGSAGACAVTIQNGGTVTSVENTALPDGNYRVRFGFKLDVSLAGAWGVGPGSTIVGEAVIALAMQIEEGGAPTGLITTSGAPTTRLADVASLGGAAWTGANSGSLVIDASADSTLDCPIASVTSASGRSISLYRSQAGYASVAYTSAAGSQVVTTTNGISAGADHMIGLSWDPTGLSICANGASIATGIAPDLAGIDTLAFSAIGLGEAYGPAMIHAVTHFQTRLSDAELQAITGL